MGSESHILDGERNQCTTYLNCFDELATDDVCFGVSAQGNENSNGQLSTVVTVSARYQLVGTAAKLIPPVE